MFKVWIKTVWKDRDGWEITLKVDGNGSTVERAIKDAKRRTQAFYDECKWARYFNEVYGELISVEDMCDGRRL